MSTPLVDVSRHVGYGCTALAKCAYLDPTGSHYGPIYLELFKGLEEAGKITRGQTHLIEVSSGSAGASFGWLCRELGYPATLIVPQGTPETIIQYIRSKNEDMKIIIPDRGNYLVGAVETLQEILRANKSKPREERVFALDHSRNGLSLIGARQIAADTINQCQKAGIEKVDFNIAAFGNGITIVGMTPELNKAWPDLKTISFAPNPVADDIGSGHALFGTSGIDIPIPFPFREKAKPLIEELIILTKQEQDLAFSSFPDLEHNVGNTSLAALSVARRVAIKNPGSTIFLMFYDSGVKYGRRAA